MKKIHIFPRLLLLTLAALFIFLNPTSLEISAAVKATKTVTTKAKSNSSKTKKKRVSNRKTSKSRKGRGALISVIYNDPQTGEWIHRGKRKIVIHKDSTGDLRAMVPFSANPHVAHPYAEIINTYASKLKPHHVNVFSVIAPTQGEFYMPDRITDNLSQEDAILEWNKFLNQDVTPILLCDTLKLHKEEEIYLHTDHHWSALGAYYAAAKIAKELGDTTFFSLEDCMPDTVKNFVGTMYNFSGDAKILEHPENFIYYVTPGDNNGEFIDYTLKANKVAYHETAPHLAPLFRKFNDGSRSAYSTFLGGDNHTVKTINLEAPVGRKILLVKDSYGNALMPYLKNSFSEVHIIDFRHFPHSLTDYIIQNGITDVVFVNCIELAFTPSTAERLRELFKSRHHD